MLKKLTREILMKFKLTHFITKAYKLVFILVGKLPADQKLVMFESFHGKQFSCNPRAIYEYLKANDYPYRMVWSVHEEYQSIFKQHEVEYVKRLSLKWLFLMARSRYWITNARLPLWIPKPDHTTYIQTWHGTPLKRLASDMAEVHMPGTDTVKYKKNFTREAKKWDYLISPNKYSTDIFARAFDFNNNMIESGYPRNDILHQPDRHEVANNVKLSLNIPLDKKIILYAPTWRDDEFYTKGKYKFDIKLDLMKMKEQLGEDFVILLRMHYLISENIDVLEYDGFVYDVSNHSDIRELYVISDMLITDYSSVFFDYGNLKRPIIFFVYDIDKYRDTLRGFYFDFEREAPGPLVKTSDEVIQQIKTIHDNGFTPSDEFNSFYHKFCYLEDGNASKRVVERVFH
jgi:CDP-glycerol glycerophosphotransferase